ncbi:MAG: hypothetical protein JOZ33_18555 [Acidobacteriaceae bacterium]|nr:hypothetical protein [Acidobacteriaceae bacterium]
MEYGSNRAGCTDDLAYPTAVTSWIHCWFGGQWNLSFTETWLGPNGRSELAQLLAADDSEPNSRSGADSPDELLKFLLEYIWGHRSPHLIDLEKAWELRTGMQAEL